MHAASQDTFDDLPQVVCDGCQSCFTLHFLRLLLLLLTGDESGVTVPPFVVRFSLCPPQTHFAVADEDGKIRILDSTKPASKACIKEFDAHNNAIFDVAWFPSDPGLLISASGDQTLALWDVASALKVDHCYLIPKVT